jgi:hypothetical protein
LKNRGGMYKLSALFNRPKLYVLALNIDSFKQAKGVHNSMQTQETLQEVAALRHNFHVNHRLRLEFLGSLSKLFRDYGIQASDELLGSLVLSVPEEILSGPQNGNGNGHHTAHASSDSEKTAVPPAAPGRTSPPPVSPDRAMPPRSPDRTAVPPAAPGKTAVPPASPDRTAVPPAAPGAKPSPPAAPGSALPPRSPA